MWIFLFLFLVLLSITALYSYKLFLTRKTWREADLSDEIFLSKHQKVLQKIKLGCSFSIEKLYSTGLSEREALECLRIVVEDLGMDEVRLGLRWNKVPKEGGGLDLSFYKPFLDYCFSKKVNVCLNIGPIKVFQWPEEHIPDNLPDVQYDNLKKTDVRCGGPLSNYALKYVEELLVLLKKSYLSEDLKNIKIIQIENEAFNRMGDFGMKMGVDYMEELVKKVRFHFPEVKILFNSAGRFQLWQIVRVIKRISFKNKEFFGDFVVGYDYYYKTANRDKFFLSKKLDSIDFSIPFDMSVARLRRLSRKYKFGIEVTEAQFEPWGENYPEVGNSVRDFRFMVLRVSKVLDLEKKENGVVRLWGIENFGIRILRKEINGEHEKIIEIIKKINSCKS